MSTDTDSTDRPTAAIARRVYRELVALVFVAVIASVWVLTVLDGVPIAVSLTPIQQTVIDALFYTFALASAFLVFGERTIRSAVRLYKQLRGQ